MKAAKKHVMLALLPIVIPAIVALVQIFLVHTSDLSRWKGGGFGMYSDPHPHNRMVWLRGKDEGDAGALRVFPLDRRLRMFNIADRGLREDLVRMQQAGRLLREFPSFAGHVRLDAAVHRLRDRHGDKPVISRFLPRTDVSVAVLEMGISRGFDSAEVIPVYQRPLCAH